MRAVIASAAVVAAAGIAVGIASGSGNPVKVTEKEWGVTPLPATVKAGKVTFTVKNIGHLSHELVVLKTKTPAAKLKVVGAKAVVTGVLGRIPTFKPGQTRTLTLTLKPGHYVLLCNLPAHYQAGQRVDFTVK